MFRWGASWIVLIILAVVSGALTLSFGGCCTCPPRPTAARIQEQADVRDTGRATWNVEEWVKIHGEWMLWGLDSVWNLNTPLVVSRHGATFCDGHNTIHFDVVDMKRRLERRGLFDLASDIDRGPTGEREMQLKRALEICLSHESAHAFFRDRRSQGASVICCDTLREELAADILGAIMLESLPYEFRLSDPVGTVLTDLTMWTVLSSERWDGTGSHPHRMEREDGWAAGSRAAMMRRMYAGREFPKPLLKPVVGGRNLKADRRMAGPPDSLVGWIGDVVEDILAWRKFSNRTAPVTNEDWDDQSLDVFSSAVGRVVRALLNNPSANVANGTDSVRSWDDYEKYSCVEALPPAWLCEVNSRGAREVSWTAKAVFRADTFTVRSRLTRLAQRLRAHTPELVRPGSLNVQSVHRRLAKNEHRYSWYCEGEHWGVDHGTVALRVTASELNRPDYVSDDELDQILRVGREYTLRVDVRRSDW